MKRVAHLTSAHQRNDTRIYLKMCRSLSYAYDVSLFVADGLGDSIDGRVSIIDVGKCSGSLLKRITTIAFSVFNRARIGRFDLYHLHDPELVLYGVLLKLLGKRVIFDAHEDFPAQIKGKRYLGGLSKLLLSRIAWFYEYFFFRFFDSVICATDSIKESANKKTSCATTIYNYPIVGELQLIEPLPRENIVLYVGAMSHIRGIEQLVRSMEYTDGVQLHLAGHFNPPSFKKELEGLSGWKKVVYHGSLDRPSLAKLMSEARVGIVPFLDLPNHREALPNKLFEYMSAALPVIATNFPNWEKLIFEANCGFVVDPENTKEMGISIQKIIDEPQLSEAKGVNAQKAIMEQYNWRNEKEKLLNLYKKILN
jgi:glycosyltransferase involved in cell wall biosynthesis